MKSDMTNLAIIRALKRSARFSTQREDFDGRFETLEGQIEWIAAERIKEMGKEMERMEQKLAYYRRPKSVKISEH